MFLLVLLESFSTSSSQKQPLCFGYISFFLDLALLIFHNQFLYITKPFHVSECVELLLIKLLKKNTNLVEAQDDYGWTVFHFAAYKDFHRIVRLILAKEKYVGNQSVVYKLDKKGRIAFHVAAYEGAVRVMKVLLEYYPDSWEIVDGTGRNVLHIAVEKNQRRVITFILSQGSATSNNLLNQRDNEGNTPLHLIAKLACYIPELMDEGKLDWKVDWEVTDNNNLTPLDVLQSKQETDTLSHTVRELAYILI